jgi:hypothetical protein
MVEVLDLLIMIVRAVAMVDVVDSFVPVVVHLLDVQLVAYQINKPELLNFRVEVGMHQCNLIVVVEKEVLLYRLAPTLIIQEFQCLLLDL